MKNNYLSFKYEKFEDGSGWEVKHGFCAYGIKSGICDSWKYKKGLNKLKKLHQWIGKVIEDIEDKRSK